MRSVDVTSAVSPDSSTYRLARLEQRVGGQWVTVGKGAPVVARAGRALSMRAVLVSGTTTKQVAGFQLDVAQQMAGAPGPAVRRRSRPDVGRGGLLRPDADVPGPASARCWPTQVRNDQLSVTSTSRVSGR